MYYEVLPGGRFFKGKDSLTYSSEETLAIGQVVSLSIRQSRSLGIVYAQSSKPDFKVKPIDTALPYILPSQQLALLDWLRQYYPAPLGSLVDLFLPSSLNKKTSLAELEDIVKPAKLTQLPPLTTEQVAVMGAIKAAGNTSILLKGDTGTGKTRIYLECAKQAAADGKSALILTPEIGLTAPLKEQFEQIFGKDRVIVMHSAMTPKEKRSSWIKIQSATVPLVVIGPRSALFVPVRSLGLVVVDEAHDTAYKQEQLPYYQASRVAGKLAQLHKALFIMGTATPNIVDYYNFKTKSLPILSMTKLATPGKFKTEHKIIDLKDKADFSRSNLLSDALISLVAEALANNEQSLVFLNRRGSARLILCNNCGWQARCPRCDVALTYHEDKHRALCHSCGYYQAVPSQCPDCSSADLLFRIGGTKAVEMELNKFFPDANIRRFDKDNLVSERLHTSYADVQSGEVNILIGTQAIVKGFDLPKLSVIGVVQADSGLQIADYTAAERTYQLISQVAGRIGRGHRAGTLVIQTYHPESHLIKWSLEKNYDAFYQRELEHRLNFGFPPACYLLKISFKHTKRDKAEAAIDKAAEMLRQKGLNFIGPSPRYPEKVGNNYRFQVVVKSKNRQSLTEMVNELPVNYTCDLDPSDLL